MSRTVFALAVVLLAAAGPALAQSEGCLEATLDVVPASVCPGGTATLSASLVNCGEEADYVTLSVSALGAAFSAPRLFMPAGYERAINRQVMVPARVAPGEFLLSVTATSRFGAQVTVEKLVTILPPESCTDRVTPRRIGRIGLIGRSF